MNEHTRWQQENDRYLAAAIAWLRLRLERLAPSDEPPAPAPQPPTPQLARPVTPLPVAPIVPAIVPPAAPLAAPPAVPMPQSPPLHKMQMHETQPREQRRHWLRWPALVAWITAHDEPNHDEHSYDEPFSAPSSNTLAPHPPIQNAPPDAPLSTAPVLPLSPDLAAATALAQVAAESEPAVIENAAPEDAVAKDAVAEAEAALHEIEAGMEPPPALLILGEILGLSRFEREVLLLCVAMELDTRIAGLCARAQDDPGRPFPTFALCLTLFDEPSWDVQGAHSPLRFWRLLEIHQPGHGILNTSPLRADERIVNYVKGLNALDDRLAPFVTPLPNDDASELPPSQQRVLQDVLRRWEKAGREPLPVVQLLGPDAASKQMIAARAAAKLGRRLYRLPVELLPLPGSELETLARLWQREVVLLPLALYVDAEEQDGTARDGGAREGTPPLSRFFARSEGIFFLGTREAWPHLGRAGVSLEVHKPDAPEQRAAWAQILGDGAGDNPGRLAGQFSLNLRDIRDIAGEVLADKSQNPRDALWDACLSGVRPRMDALAEKRDARATWDDLVLPAEQLSLLRQIADQVGQRSRVYQEWGFGRTMNRGLGISALFAGDSGTGKTLAAEVLANALRLHLYRVDLSAVVSKYIGETEKNLRKLFDAAEDGGAILFFDEADALFSKRSEVKDSHDRYANIEVNYLLQRMESYGGLAILASNLKSSLDTAFVRRLRFIVNFPFPGPQERRQMWQRAFPHADAARGLRGAPLAPLDFERLARLNLAGGSIHNIALNAAFLAARANAQVTMPLVLQAARDEMMKLDRAINESDFRWSEKPALPAAAPLLAEPAHPSAALGEAHQEAGVA